MCDRCTGPLADLSRCQSCAHQQIVRAQEPRGCVVRDGIGERVVAVAGEIK